MWLYFLLSIKRGMYLLWLLNLLYKGTTGYKTSYGYVFAI